MNENKKTYYIKVSSGEITQSAKDSPWDFKIEATDDDIIALREYFDLSYDTDMESFYRAHIPFMEYHNDKQNDNYDANMKRIYSMIYQLGDEEAKNHIKSMGVLGDSQNI